MTDIAILPKSSKQGAQFEKLHVQKVYNEIAESVNDIQHKAWPNVKRFLKKLEPGSLVADIGCGNGRYLSINKNTYKVGLDVCQALVDSSKSKGYQVVYADNLHIPFRNCLFDGVVSIGVIHHFCSYERRIAAVKELSRIIRPGGKLMLYVWAYEQKRRKFDSQDVLIPWHHGTKDLTRTGSSSSRHSSIGGLSSTSSVSDDSLEQCYQSLDSQSKQASPRMQRRQSSISLDDLATVSEMSYFKPSYYALDFNGSPKRKMMEKSRSSISADVNSNMEYFDSKETSLVSECRKFEASLRAMSTGNLEELKRKGMYGDFGMETKVDKKDCQHYSLDTLDSSGCMSLINEQAHFEKIENVLNNCKCKDNKIIKVKELDITAMNMNGYETSNISIHDENGRDLDYSEQIEHPKGPKMNPFLKQDSLDPYTFNNVLNTENAGSEADIECLEDIFEGMNVEENQDEVFVNFKPNQKESTRQERSFFSSLKLKLGKIFDDEKVSRNVKNKTKIATVKCKPVVPTNFTFHRKSFGSADLTPEQLNIATKLNFQVREFPQSSCRESLKRSNSEVIHVMSNTESQENTFCQKQATKSNLNIHTESSNGKDYLQSENIHTESLNGRDYLQSKNIHYHDAEDQGAGNTDEHVNRKYCSQVYLNSNEGCLNKTEDVEVIYDSYMKIDIDTNDNEEFLNENNCALDAKTLGGTKTEDGVEIYQRVCGENSDDLPKVTDGYMCNKTGSAMEESNICVMNPDQCNTNNEKTPHEVSTCYLSQDEENSSNSIRLENKIQTEQRCMNGNITSADDIFQEQIRSQRPDTMQTGAQESDAILEADCVFEDSFSSKLCRYYHVFREGELEALITSHVKDLHVVQCFYDHANWCVVAEKV